MPPPKGTPNPLEGPGDFITDPVHSDTYQAIDSSQVNIHGKAVFISGASKGIGRSIALSFAKAGASCIAVGARSDMTALENELHEAARSAQKSAPKVLQIKLDVTSRESIDRAAATVEKEFGKIDIVVNNAGILGQKQMIADSDPDEWWNTWVVNLRGPYLITRAFLPLMLKGGDKTFVTISSVGAHLSNPTLSDYQPSKLAVLRFTEFIAAEYGSQGVLAYAIHPGNVPTDILGPDGPSEALKFLFVDTTELSADTIVFLTKEKREWLNGRYINSCWDMPQLMAMEEEIVKGDKLRVRLVV